MSERRSYPAAENPDFLIQVLEFIAESLFPRALATKLTKRYRNKFPILYNLKIQKHLTSDYFQLLEMLGLCEITEKSNVWYIYEFSEFLQKLATFPEDQVRSEVLDAADEFNLEGDIEAYEITQKALDLLGKKSNRLDFLLSYFYRFLRLEPPYFRYVIQHPDIIDLSATRKTDLRKKISLIIKEKFPSFSSDDTARILGWSEYFRILRKARTKGQEGYSFNLGAIVQCIGQALAHYLNERCQKITHLVWHELELDLYEILFYHESFLRLESLLNLLLDQNPGKYRWGIIERGPGRYKGFREDPAKQFLQIKETPLLYSYKADHVSRVVKR